MISCSFIIEKFSCKSLTLRHNELLVFGIRHGSKDHRNDHYLLVSSKREDYFFAALVANPIEGIAKVAQKPGYLGNDFGKAGLLCKIPISRHQPRKRNINFPHTSKSRRMDVPESRTPIAPRLFAKASFFIYANDVLRRAFIIRTHGHSRIGKEVIAATCS